MSAVRSDPRQMGHLISKKPVRRRDQNRSELHNDWLRKISRINVLTHIWEPVGGKFEGTTAWGVQRRTSGIRRCDDFDDSTIAGLPPAY